MKKENLVSKNVPSTINARGIKVNGFIFFTEIRKIQKQMKWKKDNSSS